jgi:stalled ribosome alternative rescue factor ArfA
MNSIPTVTSTPPKMGSYPRRNAYKWRKNFTTRRDNCSLKKKLKKSMNLQKNKDSDFFQVGHIS